MTPGSRLYTVVLVLVLNSSAIVAQNNFLFRVLANSGVNEIKTGELWKPIKTGSSLYENDVIRLKENSYVGLIHSNGKSRELRKAGTYNIKELASTIINSPGVLVKYVDFLLSKNSEEAKKNRLLVVGSATRSSFKEDIIVYLPENHRSNLLNPIAIVNWESKSDTPGPFIVTVQNMINQDLIVSETSAPGLTLDFNSPQLSEDLYFLIHVKNKNDQKLSSDQYLIKKLQPDEQQKWKSQLAVLTEEVTEESALDKLILASFYENNLFFIDAIVAYEEAIKLAPEVEAFKEIYQEFLYRNRLKYPK